MGNCQAIDNASLVIQQPCGRVDKMYWPVPATDIMKMNPGYYVALLLTTTLYPPSSTVAPANNEPLRVTRIKLLRPTDNLLIGHTYRLVSSQEVMKGLWAKKYSKMQKQQPEEASGREGNTRSDFDIAPTRSSLEKKTKQVIKHDRRRTKTTTTISPSSSTSTSTHSATVRPRGWHPSLQSISEATS